MVMRPVLLAVARCRSGWSVLLQEMGSALAQRPEFALPRVLELALGRLASLVLWRPGRWFAQSMRTELPASARCSVGRTVLGRLLEGLNYLD